MRSCGAISNVSPAAPGWTPHCEGTSCLPATTCLSDPPFTRIDLVVCRNLLIYLKPQAQVKALSQLHFSLKPHGLLLLGASETVGDLESLAFSAVDRSNKLFRKQPAMLPRALEAHVGCIVGAGEPSRQMPDVAGKPAELLEAELLSTQERLHEMVLELQASHERVDLSNEELTASNEELQSTNEELKSVNEDLYTLNRELEDKNEDLAELNRDYDHLLASTEIGTVFRTPSCNCAALAPPWSNFWHFARMTSRAAPVSDISYRLGLQQDFLADLQRCAQKAPAWSARWHWATGAGCSSACCHLWKAVANETV